MQVKEQTMCTLWNLSVDKEVSARMTSSEILPLLVKYLEDEDVKVKETAGGVLANLALTQSNHKLLVEAGVIPKLVRLSSLPLFSILTCGIENYSVPYSGKAVDS